MNIRQIKLALTVDLMNQNSTTKPILFAREAMGKFKSEVGEYVGLLEKGTTKISDTVEQRSFALQYENCTLNMDLILNRKSNMQSVQGFDIKANAVLTP